MTALISHEATDHDDRVHAIGAVLTSCAVLIALVVGAGLVVSQLLDVASWALTAH
ncbi:hypothetical protein ACGIF2_13440 [Cellulomonas sp. P22]|uniref:hypothetical protein n=1 Tax=Cellulomonas sp. P22 TaxID=3373189 RepID=UPI0037982239